MRRLVMLVIGSLIAAVLAAVGMSGLSKGSVIKERVVSTGTTTTVAPYEPTFTEKQEIDCSAHRYQLLMNSYAKGGPSPTRQDWDRIINEEQIASVLRIEACGEPDDSFYQLDLGNSLTFEVNETSNENRFPLLKESLGASMLTLR